MAKFAMACEGPVKVSFFDAMFYFEMKVAGKLVEVTVLERPRNKIIWWGRWDRKKREFVPGRRDG